MKETTVNQLPSSLTLVPKAFATITTGILLFMFVSLMLLVGFQASYSGRIFPGIKIAGADVSGLEPREAAVKLSGRLEYPAQGRIVFQDGTAVWQTSPAELGLQFDPVANANFAYNIGRRGSIFTRLFDQFKTWFWGQDLPPVLTYDERVAHSYLVNLAQVIDRPTLEASIGLNGVDVTVRSGQVGRKLDIDATLQNLGPQMQTMKDSVLPLIINETPPVILDASEQAEIAKRILSAPLVITAPSIGDQEPAQWVLEPESLAGMLTIERISASEGDEAYRVGIDTQKLTGFLESLAPNLEVQPVNARFIFNDDTRELEVIQKSITGRSLLVDASVEAINQNLAEGVHNIQLVFDYRLPAVTSDATAAELGITELVSEQSSYFYGSSTGRIQNIAKGSSQFHGVLVAPGETFSMASILGDISLDNGYSEALIIFGDRTIKGVGGGICQVSTTLFRTVFFGGFQIDERYSHAYRVYYYELTASGSVNTNYAGLDATVYVPLVDFKFTNDSPYWLLMETYVNEGARSLTWKFYSTSDGRQIDWSTTGLRDKVEPPDPLYQENPDLKKGEVKQVDWAVEGANVSVARTVTRNGEVISDDVFKTQYQPWRAVYEYGPGTKGMPPKDKDKDGE